mgnify:CR=1 FL=1
MAINRTLLGCAGAALALSVGLGGFGSAALAAKDELVIGAVQFPGTFHPSIDAMATKSYILGAARRPFTTFNQDWKLICLLCTELPSLEKGTAVEVTRPDGTRAIDATFTIQPGATWGDGRPLTTRDVLFTWEVGRHPLSGVTNAQLFSKDIVGITAVDDKTFTVHWDKYRCSYDSINDLLVLPEHLERPVFEADPSQYRNRTLYDTDRTNPGLYFGPYRISRVESGAYVVLEPNPTWWGDKPGFNRIVVRTIENTSAMEANLLSGEVDYVAGEVGLSIEQALAFEKRHGQRFRVVYQPGLFFEHIDLNLDNGILADVRVRRALLTAIDRDAISRQLFGGKQPVAHTGVNPLDRFYSEDFTRYPRTPEADVAGLEQAGCDAVWLPSVEAMYPLGVDKTTRMHAPGVSEVLEGASRPGHFDGVCTVVARLFLQVQPDVAVFGRKDYQQLAVIKQMVAELSFPVQIVGAEIVRDEDGLAKSSRNQYLSAEQRPVATTIHRTLLGMREGYVAGQARERIEAEATAALQAAGFQVDYAVLRTPELAEPTFDGGGRVALIAARLGTTRLIDNLEF